MTRAQTKIMVSAQMGAPGIKINHLKALRVAKMTPSQYQIFLPRKISRPA